MDFDILEVYPPTQDAIVANEGLINNLYILINYLII